MKHLLIILFLIFNCSAQEAEFDIVNDFLGDELLVIPHDTVYVIQESLDKMKSLEMYEKAFGEKKLTNDSPGKQIWIYPELESWPLLERDIDKIKNKLSKSAKDEFWSYKDFKSKSYIIHHEKVLRARDFAIKHGSSKSIILNLSRPIVNGDKTYAFFQFYPSFIIGGSAYETSGVILMKYESKKWHKVAVIMDAVYH